MSRLKKAYEISLWQDIQDSQASFTEQRVAVIGADSMKTPCRALTPKFKKSLNGTKELTFKMHRQYKDPVTGEQISNPFVDLIGNESKIKLYYQNAWYDFIVKNIQQDSSNSTVSYTATDLFVNELSKNGFHVVMDTSLMNNSGTLSELGAVALADTGWSVGGTGPKQYITEQLVLLKDPSGELVYGFYSSCKDQPIRFQYVTNLGALDTDGVYGWPTQTYIDMRNKSYTTSKEAAKYGFTFPVDFQFIEITQARAKRLVYTHKSKFNAALNKIVYSYNSGLVEGYSTTDYITPNLIQNLVTNNTFKSTNGWTGSYFGYQEIANKGSEYNAIVESVAVTPAGRTLIEAFQSGNFATDTSTYTPCLRVKFPKEQSVLINSGFYDNRNLIKNLAPKQKFVLLYKHKGGSFTASVGVSEYEVKTGYYSSLEANKTFITFKSKDAATYYKAGSAFNRYNYIIGTVSETYNIADEKSYKKLKTQMFLQGQPDSEYQFDDLQIFPYYEDPADNSLPLLPENSATEAQAVTEFFYYRVDENPTNPAATGYRATGQEYKYCAKSTQPLMDYSPDFTDEKIGIISVKQSNYFNIIQTLCEKFEVWADLVITHDAVGRVTHKAIVFSEGLTSPNYGGFRYGVNLKNSKRTIDSKNIVTKLIVPDNTNEFAENGFCSIARAGANQSGENYLYDFSYYYNFGLLDRAATQDLLERPGSKEDSPLQGYYVQLLELNSQLNVLIDRYSALAKPLMQADANRQVAESGKIAAQESYEDAAEAFLKAAGYGHTEIFVADDQEATLARQEQTKVGTGLYKHLVSISEYYAAWQKYIKEEYAATAAYEQYKLLNDELVAEIELLNSKKAELNTSFYQSFYRFIQEGTWKSDEHTDNEKYYYDAYTTLKNSSVPKVSYTFSIIDLSSLEGYQGLQFELADRTWVEDPELFGDAREEVVITEIVYVLDEPEQNSVKMQNYRDQFADLFQKITATTQQVKYASASWEKAGAFTDANPVQQAAFLQNALTDAEMKLLNAGEQSVVWDKTGITVTDLDSPNQQLRIIGGAIMMRDKDKDGLGWKVGITSKGISAKLLTAGQINTGVISIMNGDEPYFRWDAFGISAYWFNEEEESNASSTLHGLDTTKGVRFDRFGIYGYSGQDGLVWHPESIEEVWENSLFALTWKGLRLKLGQGVYNKGFNVVTGQEVELKDIWHLTTSKLGQAGKYVYNTWVDGYPSYDPTLNSPTFVKVMTIADGEENEQLVIYDDGTLVANNVKLTGQVSWVPEASPARSVYGPIELANHKPNDKWYYKDIPDHDPGLVKPKEERWHKVKGTDDVLYCHTDTAGAIWDGPFLITGRSIDKTVVEYAVEQTYLEPDQVTDWLPTFPTDISFGMYLFTRTYDLYNDKTQSSYRYQVNYYGQEGASGYSIELSNESATISATSNGDIDTNTLKKVSHISVKVWYGDTDITESCQYTWSVTGGTLENSDKSETCFVTMTEDTAYAYVMVKQGEKLLGIKEFAIAKSKSGEDAILCYIHSSMGNLFETTQSGNTVLTAHIFRGEVEIDKNGTEFEYSWYVYEKDSTSTPTPLPNEKNKQLTIPIQSLINKDVYFTAQSK